jgi:murein DD-endopeptidase MepM/ murein hydrolase activator NlpD
MLHAPIKTLRVFALLAITLLTAPNALCSDAMTLDSMRLTPEPLSNGAPFLITVALQTQASEVTGTWQDHLVLFFSNADHRTCFALAGVDVEVHPGSYPLSIDATLIDGTHQALHKDVSVEEAPYEKVPLSVPDKFVEPNAAAQKRIAADKIVRDKALANSALTPQWSGNFLPPLHHAPQSDSFGNQRIFDGELASVHRGLDYRAKAGTAVAAINSGRVVLAQPLYYEGGCVIIDHGLGLMSIYMHLSKIEVSVGKKVRRGQIIALSGATGRVTGPHLHLGIRWQGSYLDAAKLFQIRMPQTASKPAAAKQCVQIKILNPSPEVLPAYSSKLEAWEAPYPLPTPCQKVSAAALVSPAEAIAQP